MFQTPPFWHACKYALDLNTQKVSAKSGYFNTAHNFDLPKPAVGPTWLRGPVTALNGRSDFQRSIGTEHQFISTQLLINPDLS